VHIKHILAATAVVFLGACSDTSSPDPNAGALSFTFTGDVSGTFNVSGVFPTIEAQVGNADAAAGHKDTEHGGFDIAGVRAQAAGRFDLVTLFVPRLTAGSETINVTNCDTEGCAGFLMFTGVSNTDSHADSVCGLGTGTITVSSVTDTHVQGTFSGLGSCTADGLTFTVFNITSGSFDVPLITSIVGT